jgi:hypothetical protein
MPAWNLDAYEDAASLNRWFQENYPDGSILITRDYFDPQAGEVLFRCDLYRRFDDANPAVQNWARGKRADYPANMTRWYVEDTATSCVARAILLLKGGQRAVAKVVKTQQSVSHGAQPNRPSAVTAAPLPSDFGELAEDAPLPTAADSSDDPFWEGLIPTGANKPSAIIEASDDQSCPYGTLVVKEGKSKSNGKPYKGSFCQVKPCEKCPETKDGLKLKDGVLWWKSFDDGTFELPRGGYDG